MTIQYAVNQATEGDTIEVAPGNYTAGAKVEKSVTLRGAQAGVDARTRAVPQSEESVIAPVGTAFTLPTALAGPVTIDGFRIAPTGVNAKGVAVMGAGGVGHVIENDVFANITEGTAVQGIFKATTFEHDRVIGSKAGFEANTQSADGTKIIGNLFESIAGGTQWDVNVIRGGSGMEIRDNRRIGVGGNFLVLQRTTGALVAGNIAEGIDSSALFMADCNAGTVIEGNDFSQLAPEPGIALSNIVASPNTGTEIVGNALIGNAYGVLVSGSEAIGGGTQVHANRIVGSSVAGVQNPAGSGGTVDATDNWWGCNEGPTVGGSNACDEAGGEVEAAPWLVLTAAAGSSSLVPGSSTPIVAKIDTDSAGLAAAPPPDGSPVTFVTDLGSLSPASAVLAAGAAGSILSSSAAGTAHVSVGVDAATVPLTVTFESPPPVESAPPIESPPPVEPSPSTSPPAEEPTGIRQPVLKSLGGG